MRIYFEDGPLIDRDLVIDPTVTVVAATLGFSSNMESLRLMNKFHPTESIYTNAICALSNEYGWDNVNNMPNIFIRDREDNWKNIQSMTEREIRYGHNIMKMFMNGVFQK